MKKQNVIAAVGALALLANLLVPGLAFGQDTGGQSASQTINCPAAGPTVELAFDNTPDDVTFDTLTASPNNQNSFDSVLNDDETPPVANLMELHDTRSGDVDGCPTANPGFSVTVVIDSPLTNATSDQIPSTAFRAITSNDFGVLRPDCFQLRGEEVCYGSAAGTGNNHDVDAPVLYDDFIRDPEIIFDKFNTAAIYTTEVTFGDTEDNPTGGAFTNNTLNVSVTLLNTTTSHNSTFHTNVELAGIIPGNQDPGIYSGTLLYTLSAV